jgi:type IV pilus assembly protein PilN
MHQPKNAAVLSQSQFLNQLFARKAFSWTAVMMDLENVLPSGVQVLNIDPVISRDGKVTIRLRVSGQRMIVASTWSATSNIRAVSWLPAPGPTRRRRATRTVKPVEQVSATSNVNFDLLAEYNPLPDGRRQSRLRRGRRTPAVRPEAKRSRSTHSKVAAGKAARKPQAAKAGAP